MGAIFDFTVTNPEKVIQETIKSLTFSLSFGILRGEAKLTPEIEWLFTESPLVFCDLGGEGSIKYKFFDKEIIITYEMGKYEPDGEWYITYSI